MKSRSLLKHLNNTTYVISNHTEYIAVGNGYVHDLISVNKKTLEVKYGLDTFREGRKAIKNPELEFIWDKMHELIATGEIKDIIEGNDTIENALPVFTFEKGELIETHTDKYGYPNTTYDGELMYDNTHFKTAEEAIEKGIREYGASVEYALERVADREEELQKAKENLQRYQKYLEHFKALKNKK